MTGVFLAALGFLGFLGMTTLADMVSEEVRDRLDHLPQAILRLAARRLDPSQRVTIYQDEWFPELSFILTGAETRPITRLITGTRYALGILLTASRIARDLHRASPRPVGEEKPTNALQHEMGYRSGRGPLARAGDALIYLTSADRTKIGSAAERNRYVTVGLLMLVTAAQAFYAASLFLSVSLGKPFSHEIAFGVPFAAAVLLVDRSIIGHIPSPRLSKKGKLKPPRRVSWTLVAKVMISVVAALLMSEMLLVQVFAKDVQMQVQVDRVTQIQQTTSQIDKAYQKQIVTLRQPMDQDQAAVNSLERRVNKDYGVVECQKFGCPGILAGMGPGYQNAQRILATARKGLGDAEVRLQTVLHANTTQIAALQGQELQAVKAAEPSINHASFLLSDEEALWQLTGRNGTLLVARILLSLMIVCINLASVLQKITGRTTLHDLAIYNNRYIQQVKLQHQTKLQMLRQHKQVELQILRTQLTTQIRQRSYGSIMQESPRACGRFTPHSRLGGPSCLRGCARSAPPPWS